MRRRVARCPCGDLARFARGGATMAVSAVAEPTTKFTGEKVNIMKKLNKRTVLTSLRWADLLSSMKYSKDGGLNTPDNAMHDEHFYVPDIEVSWKAPDENNTYGVVYDDNGIAKPVIIKFKHAGDGYVHTGKNPFEWLCVSIAKRWRERVDYLPKVVHTPTECENQEQEVRKTLFECFVNGKSDTAILQAFKALDALYKVHQQDKHKTAPRIEYEWKAQRAFTAKLFTGDFTTVGGKVEDLDEDSEYGGFSLEERNQMSRLVELFNAVKEAHKFARPDTWLCAQCYALNMPHEQGIITVYGDDLAKAKSAKAAKKALHSARVKYSKNAKAVFGWILDEVENQPEGLGIWVDVLNRCKATVVATDTLEECARVYGLNDEVVKTLRSYLGSMPERVVAYCEAIRSEALATN